MRTASRRNSSVVLALLVATAGLAGAQVDGTLINPIVPGDHPDPTIIRVGETYWTASTAGNWAPEFSLYRSTDLHHWTAAGAIFLHTPGWAKGDFWAPELVSDGGRVLVYYVARKRDGPLCVAVATAAVPAGPYEDHGPVLCQEDGSIDPSFVRDEHGQPFLIWKEDGNSRNQPTVIWAQPLTADLLQLTGDKTQLLVNDPKSWEGGVVEAPYILHTKGKFYLFYAGNACCGVECKYAEGVARADHLLGPWTRDPANPIIAANSVWRCPGHGTAVLTPQGDAFFVYHAYPAAGTVYLGRQSVIDSITWSADGWPVVNQGRGPGWSAPPPPWTGDVMDVFTESTLGPEWKWPIGHEPQIQVGGRKLTISLPEGGGLGASATREAFVARTIPTSTALLTAKVPTTGGSAGAGIGLIGDAHDHVVLSREPDGLELWISDRAGRRTLWKQPLPAAPPAYVWLSVSVDAHGLANFSYVFSGGQKAKAGESVPLKELLPWDSGLRAGLVVDGVGGSSASFSAFTLDAVPDVVPRNTTIQLEHP
jgi:xylan 1,4-beta-xylosidase